MNELFMPGKRHEEEERQRLEITLDEAGDADPGRGPIDLSSGIVLIRVLPKGEGQGEGQGEGRGEDD
ncbi:DUF6191 domain-containing protein [Streptomyces sp. NPDC058301]|uniref:DUF6191 domain-containing protein n=1 Tax=Streptomyces sp. NPDC058301 TaxID=3346436 RepID=UPI0036EE1BC9